MKPIIRYLYQQIERDLKQKMVFVAGPRQIGKTTLAKQFLPSSLSGYLNWDIPKQRECILKHELPNTNLWVSYERS